MIKVKNTFQHQGMTVCKGKLVLIEQDVTSEERKGIQHIEKGKLKYSMPIIISETEEIEVGDKAYNEINQSIINVNDSLAADILREEWKQYKTLALPEHFSPEQLQLIVDGKLKDGDEICLECIEMLNGNLSLLGDISYKEVRLNQQNHITLIQKSISDRIQEAKSNYRKKVLEIWDKKEESWDDILYNEKMDMYNDEQLLEYLTKNFHPPKRK